jgi:hypothetical protein
MVTGRLKRNKATLPTLVSQRQSRALRGQMAHDDFAKTKERAIT